MNGGVIPSSKQAAVRCWHEQMPRTRQSSCPRLARGSGRGQARVFAAVATGWRRSLAAQQPRQGLAERNGRRHGSSLVPDHEGLPRHVLVLPDAAGHEVACAFGYFRESRLEIGKVDPLRVRDDLIAVENVKVEARHAGERLRSEKGCAPGLEKAALQAYVEESVAARSQVRPPERDV